MDLLRKIVARHLDSESIEDLWDEYMSEIPLKIQKLMPKFRETERRSHDMVSTTREVDLVLGGGSARLHLELMVKSQEDADEFGGYVVSSNHVEYWMDSDIPHLDIEGKGSPETLIQKFRHDVGRWATAVHG